MKEIDFTIVTPSYNYAKWIGECLDSVRLQEGVSVEHLVFDAVSDDGTLDILSNYPGIDLVVEKDKGMSDAINKGFRKAKGKWVMWLNSDDVLLPGALRKVKEHAQACGDADIIFGGWNFMDGEGKFIRQMTLFPFQKTMITQFCYLGSTATFLRRETVLAEGLFLNERFKYVMDGEYYSRLSSLGKKFTYMPVIVANFRLHGASLSQRHLKADGVDDRLDLQLQWAETRAIRREYGPKFSKNEEVNSFLGTFTVVWCRGLKFALKRIYKIISPVT